MFRFTQSLASSRRVAALLLIAVGTAAGAHLALNQEIQQCTNQAIGTRRAFHQEIRRRILLQGDLVIKKQVRLDREPTRDHNRIEPIVGRANGPTPDIFPGRTRAKNTSNCKFLSGFRCDDPDHSRAFFKYHAYKWPQAIEAYLKSEETLRRLVDHPGFRDVAPSGVRDTVGWLRDRFHPGMDRTGAITLYFWDEDPLRGSKVLLFIGDQISLGLLNGLPDDEMPSFKWSPRFVKMVPQPPTTVVGRLLVDSPKEASQIKKTVRSEPWTQDLVDYLESDEALGQILDDPRFAEIARFAPGYANTIDGLRFRFDVSIDPKTAEMFISFRQNEEHLARATLLFIGDRIQEILRSDPLDVRLHYKWSPREAKLVRTAKP